MSDSIPSGEQIRQAAVDAGVDTAALLQRRHELRAAAAANRDMHADRYPPERERPVAEGVVEAVQTMRQTRRNGRRRR